MFANSKSPHELFNFGYVFERPMTLIWLTMNGFGPFTYMSTAADSPLKLREWLQAYRLAGYFGMDKDNTDVLFSKSFYNFLGNVFRGSRLQEIKDVLANKTDKDSLVKIVNTRLAYSKPYGQSSIGTELFKGLSEHLPEFLKDINYIPVYINGRYVNYVNRAVLNDINLFFKYNPDWKQEDNKFIYHNDKFRVDLGYMTLTIELKLKNWGPDDVNFVTGVISSEKPVEEAFYHMAVSIVP